MITNEELKQKVEEVGRVVELMIGKSLPRRLGRLSNEELKKSAETLGQPAGRWPGGSA